MDLSTDILHEYLQTSRRISGQFRVYYNQWSLTYPQSIVLAILESDGEMPISALAEAAGSANSTISGVVDRLEKMGLVKRVRSEADRRVIYVTTTDKFKNGLQKLTSNASSQFSRALENLSDEEQKTVLQGLKLLNRSLEQTEE
jgi:MarR family transcriptional regulator, organic hydroperoxide resistance regulator